MGFSDAIYNELWNLQFERILLFFFPDVCMNIFSKWNRMCTLFYFIHINFIKTGTIYLKRHSLSLHIKQF